MKHTIWNRLATIGLASITVLACGFTEPQDKGAAKSTGKPLPQAQSKQKVEFKGSLPKGWEKIGITDGQRQKAMQILGLAARETKRLKKQDEAAKEAETAQVKKLQTDLKAAQAEGKAKIDALKKQLAEMETALKNHPLQGQIKEIQTQATKRAEDFTQKNKELKDTTNRQLTALLKPEQRRKLEDLQ